VGPFFLKHIDILINRISRALIPLLIDPLLRRHDVDELAQLAVEIVPPSLVDVAVEAHRLVLREEQDAAEFAVEAVRKGEIDDAVEAAEGHGRLGPVAGQRLQARTLAARQDDRQHVLHDPLRSAARRQSAGGSDRAILISKRRGNEGWGQSKVQGPKSKVQSWPCSIAYAWTSPPCAFD